MDFAGLKLKNPIIIASGPTTAKIEHLEAAERNGAAGVSIKHVMTRQTYQGKLRCYSSPERVMVFPSDKRLDLAEGLELIRQAKKRTSLAVLVNFSSQEPDLEAYGRLARQFEEAGADALEINMCCPNFGLGQKELGLADEEAEGGALTGQNPKLAAAIVKIAKENCSIPVIPKLTPTALDIGSVAEACVRAGAAGLSLVGGPSLAAPPVDIYQGGRPLYPLMGRSSFGAITGSAIRYNTFKITAQVAERVKVPLTSSGGIDTWEHAIQMMMWGAMSVGICTATMWRGFEAVAAIRRGMERFLEEQGYASYEAIVGLSLKYLTATDRIELGRGHAEIDPGRCKACGACLKPGHCDAVVAEEQQLKVLADRCLGCGVCVGLCKFGAIRMVEEA
ncbi:dihydroorotate dehydrogenase [Hydrogenispora ethanolica]|jgi:dihydroorotate dehydrogenase/Pyruvate/2-oxoacid:ferredoxin oxidoreductase delta subunit|uniref:dihydrouracil dehydrogenase (NAD(+)) n=1 Tax=Hydrogenispora ethanolica TaxID=1082276 RepID=A0A4R1RW52_HYDET|nr:4Fe-4S binding protein [Hydrogenispora ethanolica]TCL70905.1 dihydroorotate dehydrogenase [Hydrogenispora ethanolica]